MFDTSSFDDSLGEKLLCCIISDVSNTESSTLVLQNEAGVPNTKLKTNPNEANASCENGTSDMRRKAHIAIDTCAPAKNKVVICFPQVLISLANL